MKTIEQIYEELIKIREERARNEERTRIIALIQSLNLPQATKSDIQLAILQSR